MNCARRKLTFLTHAFDNYDVLTSFRNEDRSSSLKLVPIIAFGLAVLTLEVTPAKCSSAPLCVGDSNSTGTLGSAVVCGKLERFWIGSTVAISLCSGMA